MDVVGLKKRTRSEAVRSENGSMEILEDASLGKEVGFYDEMSGGTSGFFPCRERK